MRFNLIIDGNFILHRNLNYLSKTGTIYGDLEESFHQTIKRLSKWYSFENIYFVSDSRKPSWRKQLYPEYKATRTKNSTIDWEFAYNAYGSFKEAAPAEHRKVQVFEHNHVEGDDWIAFLMRKSNEKGISTLIASADGDLHQLLTYKLNPHLVNIQWREMGGREKVFVPQGFQLLLHELRKEQGDIFAVNHADEFLRLVKQWNQTTDLIEEVDSEKKLLIKLLHGDAGDNIKTAYKKTNENGVVRGIGEKGAHVIWEMYKAEYPEIVDFEQDDWIARVIPMIATHKKVSAEEIEHAVTQQLHLNRSLVLLHEKYIPSKLLERLTVEKL